MARIVVCEDDPTIQKLIRTALRSTHEVRMAADGVEGLRLIEETPHPDLIVTDVSMPNMDGFQLGDAVRAQDALKDVPLLFMTASVERSAVEECYRHGATAYLGKPFGMNDLRRRIDALIRR